mmetsp:Transcript_43205/g.50579  ORF Transcript_43205/g.50579 Transcript_43205/m.50579 type:complete len:452 (-) Transcript_43205:456-1811(-)
MRLLENRANVAWPIKPVALMFGVIFAFSAIFNASLTTIYNSQRWMTFDDNLLLPTSSDRSTTAVITEKAQSAGDEIANKTISHSSEASTTPEETRIAPTEIKAEAEEIAEGKDANKEIPNFKRYDKVVIVTKIHGPHQWDLVEQSMCLLHFAYNHKVLYDIVIFTADMNIPKEKIESLEKSIAPAKISIVMDNIGFQEEIAALSPAKREIFLERCKVTNPVNLTWWSNCPTRVAYNWQAEFRSVRIWEHPALEEYKYMLWLDSDGFPSRPWEKDPVAYFIENKGVIMFDNFPQGQAKEGHILKQIFKSFNDTTACNVKLNKTKGHLQRTLFHDEKKICNVPLIHGFMHITDLDFYRQPKVINGLKKLLGNCFLCRSPDDQLAVTIPAVIYAPEKSLDMRLHGFDLKVYHNMHFDGKGNEKSKPPGFARRWAEFASKDFPSTPNGCKVTQAT